MLIYILDFSNMLQGIDDFVRNFCFSVGKLSRVI
jgi:hypothetical protein